MNIIIGAAGFAAIYFLIKRAISSAENRRREEYQRRLAEYQHSWEYQRRLNEEFRLQQENAKAFAREQEMRWREQMEENARIARENGRRDAVLAQHQQMLEKQGANIRKLNQQVSQLTQSISHLKDRLGEQYALLDYYELQQAGTTSTGREWVAWQKKITSLKNQIATTEAKLSDAKFKRNEANIQLSA